MILYNLLKQLLIFFNAYSDIFEKSSVYPRLNAGILLKTELKLIMCLFINVYIYFIEILLELSVSVCLNTYKAYYFFIVGFTVFKNKK